MRGNFGKIRKAFGNNEEKSRFLENKLLNGFAELVQEIIKSEPTQSDEELEEMFKDYGEEITEEPQKEEPKKEIKKIGLDDWVIAYTGKGESFNIEFDECFIPLEYDSPEKRKEIYEKFVAEKNRKEEAEKKKALEEEKKKSVLQGKDLLDWFDDFGIEKEDDFDKIFGNSEDDFFD